MSRNIVLLITGVVAVLAVAALVYFVFIPKGQPVAVIPPPTEVVETPPPAPPAEESTFVVDEAPSLDNATESELRAEIERLRKQQESSPTTPPPSGEQGGRGYTRDGKPFTVKESTACQNGFKKDPNNPDRVLECISSVPDEQSARCVKQPLIGPAVCVLGVRQGDSCKPHVPHVPCSRP